MELTWTITGILQDYFSTSVKWKNRIKNIIKHGSPLHGRTEGHGRRGGAILLFREQP